MVISMRHQVSPLFSEIDRLPEPETYAVIQIVDERGSKFVKPDVKSFCESIQVHGLVFRKKILCKPEFLQVSTDGLDGL